MLESHSPTHCVTSGRQTCTYRLKLGFDVNIKQLCQRRDNVLGIALASREEIMFLLFF